MPEHGQAFLKDCFLKLWNFLCINTEPEYSPACFGQALQTIHKLLYYEGCHAQGFLGDWSSLLKGPHFPTYFYAFAVSLPLWNLSTSFRLYFPCPICTVHRVEFSPASFSTSVQQQNTLSLVLWTPRFSSGYIIIVVVHFSMHCVRQIQIN